MLLLIGKFLMFYQFQLKRHTRTSLEWKRQISIVEM